METGKDAKDGAAPRTPKGETVADIVAEMRRMGNYQQYSGDHAHALANRIEVAWKRERDALMPQPDPDWKAICEKCVDGEIEPKECVYYGEPNGCNSPIYCEHPSVGNAAAMREALIIAKKAICHYAEHICQSLSWENSNLQSNCADVLCAHRVLCKAKTAINDALSEPVRNCDIAQDWLQDLYCNFKPPATVRREMPPEWVDAVMSFCQWLLAPAAERK